MTAQAVVSKNGFIGFSDNVSVKAGSAGGKISGENRFDKVINSKAGSNDVSRRDGGSVKDGGIKKIIVNDKTVNANEAFAGEQVSQKDISIVETGIVDGKIYVVSDGQADESDSGMAEIGIDGLLLQIKDFFTKKAGVSDEDFDRVLAECGFNAIDLLQIGNLQQFFVQLNEMEDFSDILTDGDLSDVWNTIMQGMDELHIELDDGSTVSAGELAEFTDDDKFMDAVRDYLMRVNGRESSPAGGDSKPEIIPDAGMADIRETADLRNVTVSQDDFESDGGMGRESADEIADDRNISDDRPKVPFNESLFESFIRNVQESVSEGERFSSEQVRQIRDIAFQIIEGVKVNVKADTSSLELSLHPEALGKVNVAIELKEGVCTANFIVRNEMAKAAVESQIQTLKETFEEQGLKVDAVEVTVSNFSFDQNRQTFSGEKDGKTEKKKVNVIDIDSAVEEADFEEAYETGGNEEQEQGINLTV